jgi:hypothetical protein
VVVFHGMKLREFKYSLLNINSVYWRLGMVTSTIELNLSAVEHVTVTSDALAVDLSDGRSITVPLAWYPRLMHATESERQNWRLIGKGYGIHWEKLDEDISVEGLLLGKPSGESQTSFKKWLLNRAHPSV